MARGAVRYKCGNCGWTGQGRCRTDINPPLDRTECPGCGRWFDLFDDDVTMSQAVQNQMRKDSPQTLAALQSIVDSLPEKYR
jgi:hypothetical protein